MLTIKLYDAILGCTVLYGTVGKINPDRKKPTKIAAAS